MKDDPIPDGHHVSRYCRGGTINEKGEVTGASFLLRRDEQYLSVNWLEHLSLSTRSKEIDAVRKVLSTKLKLGSTAKIAVLEVAETKQHVRRESPDQRDLSILHRPDEPPGKPDPSHSGIFNTQADENFITELIAEVVNETHSAK